MVKDREDQHRLQTTKLKNLGQSFSRRINSEVAPLSEKDDGLGNFEAARVVK